MSWSELRTKKWFKILSNKYLIIIVAFSIWMLFFDSNSWLVQRKLGHEIKTLKSNKAYYQKEIEQDKKTIEQLNSEEGLERYARENYFMKKDDEDVFIIEYEDSVKAKQ